MKIIEQYIKHSKNYDAYLNGNDINPFLYQQQQVDLDKIMIMESLLIIGEPGHGKTTLIKRILETLKPAQYEYYEGKSFKTRKVKPGIKYLIFDALDEHTDVLPVFAELTRTAKDEKLQLLISTREHYLPNISHLLYSASFQYLTMQPFQDHQIRAFMEDRLSTLGYDEENIEDILLLSKTGSGNSIFKVPRYLDEFCSYIERGSIQPQQVAQMSKSELLEAVVYYKLISENRKKKKSSSDTHITKRVLERLSLVLEMQGANFVSKADFLTFLDQTDSNLCLVFLSSVSWNDLLERVLKEVGNRHQFEHTEFQEYLAAKELCRLGYRFQTIFDLIINTELGIIPPHWVDVLGFAMDIDSQIVIPLITFIQHKKYEGIDERLIEMILSVDPENFPLDFRKTIFDTCFGFYTYAGHASMNAYPQLAMYLTPGAVDTFEPLHPEDKISPSIQPIIANQILIVKALADQKRLHPSTREKWIAFLCKLLKRNDQNFLFTTIFYAMIAMDAKKEILALMPQFKKREDFQLNHYLYAASELLPNHPKVTGLILNLMTSNRRVDNLERAISNFSEIPTLRNFFHFLEQNHRLAEFDALRSTHEFHGLFETIAKLNAKELDENIAAYVRTALADKNHYHRSRLLVRSISRLIVHYQEMLKPVLTYDHFLRQIDDFAYELAPVLTLDTFKMIETALEKKATWNQRRFAILINQSLSDHTESELKNYLKEKYFSEETTSAPIEKKEEQNTVLIHFERLMTADTSYFQPDIIPNFVSNYEKLKSFLTKEHKSYLLELVTKTLSSYNPDSYNVTVKRTSDTTSTMYSNHDFWYQIGSHFQTAYLLGAKKLLLDCREKFLKTLPTLQIEREDKSEIYRLLLDLYAPITKAEREFIANYCFGRTDDLIKQNITHLAKTVEVLELYELKPLLAIFIEDTSILMLERKETLSILGKLSTGEDDANTLQAIFKKYSVISSRNPLAEEANSFLISTFKREDAITWRFGQLKDRMFEIDKDKRYNGARSVSQEEHELDRPSFANCFYGIDSPEIVAGMHDLLMHSFRIREKRLQIAYSNYLQGIIYSYFRSVLDAKKIELLRFVVNQYPESEQTYFFNSQIDKLVFDLHLSKLNKQPIATSIHKLNATVAKAYLSISSNSELKEKILSIFQDDITKLIEDQGFYHVTRQLSGRKSKKTTYINEELIQKTLKIALEKSLLENGFRKVDIHREVETYDGLKYDYVINYGLYGPIVVELKLLHNPEIQNQRKRTEYKIKLSKYLSANLGLGIYVVFQTKEVKGHPAKFNIMVTEYADLSGLNCLMLKC